MKKMMTLATGIAAFAVAAGAQAGTINYSWDVSDTDVIVGETVTLSLNMDIVPDPGTPAMGLAGAVFDINFTDTPAGGLLDIASPGLGVHPDFAALGSSGVPAGNDILGVQAAQVPAVNPSLSLPIYSLTYTVVDPAPRTVSFDVNVLLNDVYVGPFQTESYAYTTSSGSFDVAAVPAPGAMALLAAAGVVGRGRRRRND